METVLIVEDSKTIYSTLKFYFEDELELNCIIATTKKECEEILKNDNNKISIALLDINLPDAPRGEVIDTVLEYKIPSIVLTGTYNETIREEISKKEIVDYVLKEDFHSIFYAATLAKRVLNNKYIKVLVVDDSKLYRTHISELLKRQQLDVLSACDGVEALDILERNPEVKIVFTDYNMPNMDGLKLTREIRKKYEKDLLSIIVISSNDDKSIPAKFIKHGASDFIYKPFSNEEFYTRVHSNLDILELFQHNKDRANKDFLTGLYNRRYFFEQGEKIFKKETKDNIKLFGVMVDIDKFKNINDTYGHDCGDKAIKDTAKILTDNLPDNSLLARFGGEEFAIISFGYENTQFLDLFEKIRVKFEQNITKYDGKEIRFTVSMGICSVAKESLEDLLNHSDKLLYDSKVSGRNKITME